MKTLAKIDRGTGNFICVDLTEFSGHQFLDIRTYYTNKAGELKPTKKGIALHLDSYRAVAQALNENKDEIEKFLIEAESKKPRSNR